MRVLTRLLALTLLLAACEPPPLVGRGRRCHSLSDCEFGLTCVEGRCSDDVSSLRGDVPTYEMGDAGALDAGADAEAGVALDAQVRDANMPRPDGATPDAAGPRDTGTPDTAQPMPEASTPDTSVPVVDAAPDVSQPDAEPDADPVADAGGD
jgi:hypothetical protein